MFIYLVLYINLKTLTLGNIVVNTLLHKLLLNMYLSKYNSVSLCCQCLNPHTMFVNYHCQTNGHNFSLYVSTRTRQLSIQPDTSYSNRSMPNQWAQSCQLSMSTWTLAIVIDRCQTNQHNLVSYQCQHGHKLVIQWVRSQLVCFNKFLSRSYQSKVSISTNVFEVYMLQVKLY